MKSRISLHSQNSTNSRVVRKCAINNKYHKTTAEEEVVKKQKFKQNRFPIIIKNMAESKTTQLQFRISEIQGLAVEQLQIIN